ncbi:MAG TPA: bifunctional UDP-N-acetylglucosamine diphosphorylase/glucosamine-1-phosphate N-acetyltransferase GlmU [Thermohalobaculum sp.]|nr:bifunctional UDP-N-acetylglucosamine diphosphorylase/glucosamine-1-phosphate N-acetyltransferase GlmU [Thermohalobaculum sp.]
MSQTEPFPPLAVVVLAAGKGTRMKSARPKVLHEIAGAPMLHHAMRPALALGPARLVVVVGHGGEAVGAAARALGPAAEVVEQTEQLGTGHAVQMAAPALEGFEGDVLVLFGDTPFLRLGTLEAIRRTRAEGADIVSLGFEAAEPGRYGRLRIGADGTLDGIVEAKDASPEELAITACNSGVMAGDAATFLRLLGRLGNDNAQGEYYLTDLVGLARAEGLTARVAFCDEAETLGINDRAELARAEAVWQQGARAAAMVGGVTMTAPETVFLSHDTRLAPDVTVEPHIVFAPGVSVARGARIRAFSHLEGAEVGEGAIVGPYARLRPGARIGRDAHIGNFVEVKNAEIGDGAKANHLTYVGDASVGAGSNLGAGTITCNYDGFLKHRTEIGEDAFIGVNAALIAPVRVGRAAYVATGTVVTEDVPDDALAIGRSRQTNRPGLARRLRAKLAAAKAARATGKGSQG